MATERTRQIALGVVPVVLAFVLYRAVTSLRGPSSSATSAASNSSSNGRARTARSAGPPPTAPDVRLRELDDERPKPISGDRNLFRFKPKPAPPEPPRPTMPPPPIVRPTPSVPTGPPPLPPIPLKFIGILEAPQSRNAALVDSNGLVYHGKEGEIVAGRYRILKIGVESIELAYLDGRGRQTIRLTGS